MRDPGATAETGRKEPSSGRPRDERVDGEVVSAVLNALRNSGYGAVTIDGIARTVRRARTTIYRRWPSKRHLVVYAIVSEMGDNPAADTGGLCARDLRSRHSPAKKGVLTRAQGRQG
jgi:AcrR family transcriptional regulator